MINYDKYHEILKTMPDPIMMTQLPKVKIDLSKLIKYANIKNKDVAELTELEQNMFIKNNRE